MDSDTTTTDGLWGSGTDSLTLTIVSELAAVRGDDPIDLPPLNRYVDLDALETLFHPTGSGRGTTTEVTFHVEEHEVRVSHDGAVDVTHRDVDRTGIDPDDEL